MEQLQSIQVFTLLVELGSFTKAANAMSIGRPQATRVIQELEAFLGVCLFQRTTRSVTITSEGKQLYQRVKSIFLEVTAANPVLANPRSTLYGCLRIDMPAAFSQPKFIENLQAFTTLFPAIELDFGITGRTMKRIGRGVDCALHIGDLPSSCLIAHRIGMVTMVTGAAPRYLSDHGSPRSLAELSTHRGVVFASGYDRCPPVWQFVNGGLDESHIYRQSITVNDPSVYVECGVAGMGIIQAPGITLDPFLADGTLVEVLRPYRPRPRALSILRASRPRLEPQVDAFVDWLHEHLPKFYRDWLED